MESYWEVFNYEEKKGIISKIYDHIFSKQNNFTSGYIQNSLLSVVENYDFFAREFRGYFVRGAVFRADIYSLGATLFEMLTGRIPYQGSSTYDILSQARTAVVCSGTATLEAAIFRVPQVVCYKANALSVAIAKAFAKVRYISLVNLIADRTVVRELIQQDLTDGVLEQEFRLVADDADTRERMLRDYDAVVALLGNGDASDRTAEVVVRQAAASGNNNMV